MFLQHLTKAALLYMMEELSVVQVGIHQAAHHLDLHQEVIPVLKHFRYLASGDLTAPA